MQITKCSLRMKKDVWFLVESYRRYLVMMLQYLILKQPHPQSLVLLSQTPAFSFPPTPKGQLWSRAKGEGGGGGLVQSIALQIWAVKMVNL